ncbi:unnamed protein product [Meganyctiphanes norvegica]|uniref:Cathepsin L n=1 Tax=Meganyctiphanes norvegica TaxID=48144 RepID=A0AAV2S070_MEGNR
MRVVALLLCGLAVAQASQIKTEWEAWKEEYGRNYLDDNEESYRQSVFEGNLNFINLHNADFENNLVTFTVGMNQFGDMTTEEIQSYMLGFKQDPSSSTDNRPVPVFTADKHEKLPTEIDWRTKAPGAVTPVKDQAQCGSCWAFSATGSLEGQHFLKTNKTVSLSEQNLVDCSMKEGDHGCFGGLMDNAFRYIKINNGIDTEASYPYKAKNGNCTFKPDNVGATVTGFVDIKSGSEKALEKAVATVGPISVAIDASQPTFHFYKKGVYHDTKCSSVHLDHGVLAVGYGVDTSTSSTWDNGKGKKYWLVKNSWNAKWGDEGYIKMARNAGNACGIATSASYPLV